MANTVSTLTLKINATQAASAIKNLQAVSGASLKNMAAGFLKVGSAGQVTAQQIKDFNKLLAEGTGFQALLSAAKVAAKSMDAVSKRMFEPLIAESEKGAKEAVGQIAVIQKKIDDLVKGKTSKADLETYRQNLYGVSTDPDKHKRVTFRNVAKKQIKEFQDQIRGIELGTFEDMNQILLRGAANAKVMQKAVGELAGANGMIKLADAASVVGLSQEQFIGTIPNADQNLKQFGDTIYADVQATETLGINLNTLRENFKQLEVAAGSTRDELKVIRTQLVQAVKSGDTTEAQRLSTQYDILSQRLRNLGNTAKQTGAAMASGNILDTKLTDRFDDLGRSIEHAANKTDADLKPTLEQARKGLLSMSTAATALDISTSKMTTAVKHAAAGGAAFNQNLGSNVVTLKEARDAWAAYNLQQKDSAAAGFQRVFQDLTGNVIRANQEAVAHTQVLKSMGTQYDHVEEETMGAIGGLQQYGRSLIVLNTSIKEQLGLSGESATSFNAISGIVTSLGSNMENLYQKSLRGTLDIESLRQDAQSVNRIRDAIEALLTKMDVKDPQLTKSLQDYNRVLTNIADGTQDVINKEEERQQIIRDTAKVTALRAEENFQRSQRHSKERITQEQHLKNIQEKGLLGAQPELIQAWIGPLTQLTRSLKDTKILVDSGANAWYLFRRALAGSKEGDFAISVLDKLSKNFSGFGKSLGPVNRRFIDQTELLRANIREMRVMAVSLGESERATEHFGKINKEVIGNLDNLETAVVNIRKAARKGADTQNIFTDTFDKIENSINEAQDSLRRYDDTLTDNEKQIIKKNISALIQLGNELEKTNRFSISAAKEQKKFGLHSTTVGRSIKRTTIAVTGFTKAVAKPVKVLPKLSVGLLKASTSMMRFGRSTKTTGNIFTSVFGANLLSRFVYDIKHSLVRGLRSVARGFVEANDAFAEFRASLTGIISGRGGFKDTGDRIRAINEESRQWFDWAKDVIASSSLEVLDVLQTIPQMMKYGFNPEEWLYPMIEMGASFNTNVDEINEAVYRLKQGVDSWRQSFRAIGIPIASLESHVKRLADGTVRAAAYTEVYNEETGDLKDNLAEMGYEQLKLLNANNELNYSMAESLEILRGWAMQSPIIRGQAEEQAKTWAGAVSNLKDALGLMAVALGKPIFDRLAEILTSINEQLKEYGPFMEKILEGLGNAISNVLELTFQWIKQSGNATRIFFSFWKIIQGIVERDPKQVILYLKRLVIGFVKFTADLIAGLAALINRILTGGKTEVRKIGEKLGDEVGEGMKEALKKQLSGAPSEFYYAYGKKAGKDVGEGLEDGIEGTGVKNIINKTFEQFTGTSLSQMTQQMANIGSGAVGGIDKIVSYVLGNLEKVGEGAVSASLRFKSRILGALSISGSKDDMTAIATEYAQSFLGPLVSVAEFVEVAMAAVVANANLDRIKTAIKAAEQARDAAIKIIEAEATQIRDQIAGLQRKEENYTKAIERIETTINEKVIEMLRAEGIFIDEQLTERLQLQLDILQFESDMNNARLEALIEERESRGIEVMSQEEIMLRANQAIYEGRLEQLQGEIAAEERKLKQRDLLANQLRIQYAEQIKGLEAAKELNAEQIDALQEQLDAKNADKVVLEKQFAKEREAEAIRLANAQTVADSMNSSVEILTGLYGDLGKSAEDAAETLAGVYSQAPQILGEAFDMAGLEAKIAAAFGKEQEGILSSVTSTLQDLGSAIVDLIESVVNLVITLFGGTRLEIPKYSGVAGGPFAGSRTQRPASDRLADLVSGLEDLAGVSEDSAFRKIPDMINKMDDVIDAILQLIGVIPGLETSEDNARMNARVLEETGSPATAGELRNLSMVRSIAQGLSGTFLAPGGAEAAEESWLEGIIEQRQGTYGKLFNTVGEDADEIVKEVRDTFNLGATQIYSDLATTDNPIIKGWEWIDGVLVRQSIVPDMVDSIIGHFQRLNVWLRLNTATLSSIAMQYSTIFSNFTPNSFAGGVQPMGGLMGGLATQAAVVPAGAGGTNFVFAPQLAVTGEVDRDVINKILTEQRGLFEQQMRNFMRQEFRR